MATGIPDKRRRDEACKEETLEDAVEYLLEEYDLKGANPYSKGDGKYSLTQLVGWLKKHKQLENKSDRRKKDILRNVLNEMMSIIRVGSTKKALYSYDSHNRNSRAEEILNMVLKKVLERGGDVSWKDLQSDLKVGFEEGVLHLEFNSAVNYLRDNGVVEKVGKSQRLDPETNVAGADGRRIHATAKAWGWGAGMVRYDEEVVKDEAGLDTQKGRKVGGSTKKTLSITLTGRTDVMLQELKEDMDSLPDNDPMKPENINRSTVVEIALWTLYREFKDNQAGRELDAHIQATESSALAADEQACPYCGEAIKAAAKKCRFCMEWLNE